MRIFRNAILATVFWNVFGKSFILILVSTKCPYIAHEERSVLFVFAHFFTWFAQNWKYFAKCKFVCNTRCCKLIKIYSFSTESINWRLIKKLWLCYSKSLSFNHTNLQIEGQKLIKQKLEFKNWILMQSFYRCLDVWT